MVSKSSAKICPTAVIFDGAVFKQKYSKMFHNFFHTLESQICRFNSLNNLLYGMQIEVQFL
jgi:hypothetical protein